MYNYIISLVCLIMSEFQTCPPHIENGDSSSQPPISPLTRGTFRFHLPSTQSCKESFEADSRFVDCTKYYG